MFGEFDRVAGVIQHGLLQAGRVANQLVGQVGGVDEQAQAFGAGFFLDHRAHVFEQAARAEGCFLEFELAGLDLRQVEHHVDDFEQMLTGGFQLVQADPLFGRQAAAADQVGHAADGIERGADFVAHVGQEGALGATGGFGSFLGLLQRGGPFGDARFQAGVQFAQRLLAVENGLRHAADVAGQAVEFGDPSARPFVDLFAPGQPVGAQDDGP